MCGSARTAWERDPDMRVVTAYLIGERRKTLPCTARNKGNVARHFRVAVSRTDKRAEGGTRGYV